MLTFIFIAFVVLKLFIFKVSCTTKKRNLWLLLGGFWAITTSNQVRLTQNFHQWCSRTQSMTYITGFHLLMKTPSNWAKNPFFGPFRRFLGYTLPRPKAGTKIFCQMKDLMTIHNRVKFHFHSICGSQVINFQKFSWQWSSHELGHFWGVLDPNSPNKIRPCWNLHHN